MATKPKMEKSDPRDTQRVVTPEFRVAFPHVFKPSGMPGADPKYSITMLFDKSQDLSALKRAIKYAKIEAFGQDEREWPKLDSPIVDGDNMTDYEGYEGCWAIKASSRQEYKPMIVDEQVQEILDQSKFYPGCYAKAQVFARVWEFGKKQGVHFILDMVQKTKDGKPFGGRKNPKDVFSPIDREDDDTYSAGEDDDGGF